MGESRLVTLVTDHDDTAELYKFALEKSGFDVACFGTIDHAVQGCRSVTPIAIIVHFNPRHDPARAGEVLRAGNPGTVLIGLFSIQLSIAVLKDVLKSFDDVIMIPCAPEALVSHVVRLQERRRRQESA